MGIIQGIILCVEVSSNREPCASQMCSPKSMASEAWATSCVYIIRSGLWLWWLLRSSWTLPLKWPLRDHRNFQIWSQSCIKDVLCNKWNVMCWWTGMFDPTDTCFLGYLLRVYFDYDHSWSYVLFSNLFSSFILMMSFWPSKFLIFILVHVNYVVFLFVYWCIHSYLCVWPVHMMPYQLI